MRKLRKFVIVSGALLLASVVFQSCSDVMDEMEKGTMGACFIQAITAGTDYVNLHWTITPTDNVEGYKVEIYQGTTGNLGSLVTSGTFEKKTYESTFSGLQPNTHYVVASQCIPAAGSGFSKADVAYMEFWTAPILTLTSVTTSAITLVPKLDDDGNPTYDEEGEPITQYSVNVTLNWAENLTVQQVNNIYVNISYYDEEGNETQVYYSTTPALSQSNPNAALGSSYSVTLTDDKVVPGARYEADLLPNPSNYSWFTTATAEWSNTYVFNMPELQ